MQGIWYIVNAAISFLIMAHVMVKDVNAIEAGGLSFWHVIEKLFSTTVAISAMLTYWAAVFVAAWLLLNFCAKYLHKKLDPYSYY